MKNAPWIIALICICTIAGHIIISQNSQIQQLQLSSELSDKARTIDGDQIRDLLYTVQQLKSEQESIRTQAYVSGAVSVLENKDHIQGIWHDGYDRGAEVTMLSMSTLELPTTDQLIEQAREKEKK